MDYRYVLTYPGCTAPYMTSSNYIIFWYEIISRQLVNHRIH